MPHSSPYLTANPRERRREEKMVIVGREGGEVGEELESHRERLRRVFDFHLQNIGDTFQMVNQAPGPSFSDRVGWEEVVKMGDRVSRQATVVGMLWVERIPDAKEIEASMTSYFNELQGFLLAYHGTMVGAGPTLLSTMQESVKRVVDSSFRLMNDSVQSCGRSDGKAKELSVFVGTVWEACSSLKKTPATNITAIGRALTQIAVTMKDVLREMKELKPACLDQANETSDGNSTGHEAEVHDEDDNENEGDDIGNDLSPEEMAVAKAAIDVVSEMLLVIKELIRSITGFIKTENSSRDGEFLMSLEKLLKLCREIGLQIDELGACLYPPQEVPAILAASGKMSSATHDLEIELGRIEGTSTDFLDHCGHLRSKLKVLEYTLGCCQVEQQLQNVSLSGPQSGH
ncbi:hypothetical protein MLD38_025770 [Melastoma candidum]|uniref:Uncharacterized protein n=1 Tax=Melastoma candidum TaxID=119954 RepID=A0ACB9NXD4_9MYRT|nr:hypothetical protein MLD38_025770 [Melastoma candidum]